MSITALALPLALGAPSSGLKQQRNRHGCWPTPKLAGKRSRRFQVNAALPVVSSVPIVGPVANLVLSPTVLLAAYCFGAVRLWQGFERTSYSSSMSTKMGLTLLWPALFAASKQFRENFKKAAF